MRTCKKCIFDLNQGVKKEYKKNEYVFFEGESVDTIYLIKSGIVKLEKIYENGETRILDVVTKGDYLALLTILKNIEDYVVSAVCLTDVTVTPILKDNAQSAYFDNLHFKETCLKCAAHRIGVFQDHTFLSTNTDIEKRILHTLKHLSIKFGSRIKEGLRIVLPITKTELAEMVGLRRETLSRKLSKMEKDGLIKVEKNIYIIYSM